MSQPGQPQMCPRCRASDITVQATSPAAGAWTVSGCRTCFYAWRSTEPAENTDPDLYPAPFRLTAGQLPDLPVAPPIPPLRQQPADRPAAPAGPASPGQRRR